MTHEKKPSRLHVPLSGTTSTSVDNSPYIAPLALLVETPTLEKNTRPFAPLPTGLDEQEDAHRHMAVRFNPHLLFCPNCEVLYEAALKGRMNDNGLYVTPEGVEIYLTCPSCDVHLTRPGSTPIRSRWKTPQW